MQLRIRADRFHRVSEQQPHTHSFHGSLQGLRDFRIQKTQQAIPSIDKRDAHAEGGKNAGVFAADYPSANHKKAVGKLAD